MNGLRVLNTRPLPQAEALDKAILNAGGISINVPALSIHATTLDWLQDMSNLTTVKHAIFISANAVTYYFTALKQTNICWPASISVIAVGNATATALMQFGIQVHWVPAVADSEHLLQLDALQNIKNQTILLIKGDGGRPLIADTLLSRGACLLPLTVYRRDYPATVSQEYINSLWQDDAVDIILFTSQQAMYNLFGLFTEEGQNWLRLKPCLVISSRLANAASLLGIQTVMTCQYDNILAALVHYNQGVIHDNQH